MLKQNFKSLQQADNLFEKKKIKLIANQRYLLNN